MHIVREPGSGNPATDRHFKWRNTASSILNTVHCTKYFASRMTLFRKYVAGCNGWEKGFPVGGGGLRWEEKLFFIRNLSNMFNEKKE